MNKENSSTVERLFHFKHFSLSDAGCAMKIGTDGVLLGSMAASYTSARTLDIGTGCGLIAFMIAQKSEAKITGIDVDAEAIDVAMTNLRFNPWRERIDFLHINFQSYAEACDEQFDLIVCNPPFFSHSLRSPSEKRNLARHTDTLRPAELLRGVEKILAGNGKFLLIVPSGQEEDWVSLSAGKGLNCFRTVRIFPKINKPVKRVVLGFSREPMPLVEEELIIESGARHHYSESYKALTKDYYLFL